MKIKIYRCSSPIFWYVSEIGKEYEVIGHGGYSKDDYKVKLSESASGYVSQGDAMEIK